MKRGDTVWVVVSAPDWPFQEVRRMLFDRMDRHYKPALACVIDAETSEPWEVSRSRIHMDFDGALAHAGRVAQVARRCYITKTSGGRQPWHKEVNAC